MSSETLVPDGLLVQTNLTGALSAINVDDSTWLTATVNNAASIVRVSFPTPAKNPKSGAGLQNFTVKYRVTPNAGLITFTAYLYENGAIRNSGASIDAWASSSAAGATRDIAWDASLLSTADGSQVELHVVTTFVGGGPGSRTTGEFQFIDWDVQHQGVSGSGAVTAQAATSSGTAIRDHVGAGAAAAQVASVAGEAVWVPTNAGFCVSQSATVTGSGYVLEDNTWTPADITTKVWLDATDDSTLTLYGVGVLVQTWGDKSGNNHNISSVSTSRAPAKSTAVQNGLNVITFDGVDDFLRTGPLNLLRNVSSAQVFAVFQYLDVNTDDERIFQIRNGNPVDEFDDDRAYAEGYSTVSSRYAMGGSNTDSAAGTLYITNYFTDQSWRNVAWTFDYAGSSMSLWVDGTNRGTSTGWGNGSNTSDTDSTRFIVGAGEFTASGTPNGLYFSHSRIGELIILENDVTTLTRQKIEGYLAWKWGLDGNLPSGHPYENGPPLNAAVYNALISDTGPLGAPSVFAARQVDAWASDGSLLGAPHVKSASTSGLISVPTMLQSPAVWSYFDFTPILTGTEPEVYIMELITPGGAVRVPISSWSATLQTGSDNSAQCVIPAAFDWMEYISDASSFSIYRTAQISGQEHAELMSSSTLDLAQYTRSSSGIVCTLTGHSSGYDEETDPESVYDRMLTGIQSISSGTVKRVRCSIDFLLRPGHRAIVRESEIIVGKIGYYVTKKIAYMDVWEAE